MKKEMKPIWDIIFRYLILILVGFTNSGIFYLIFTLVTIYPVYFLLGLFFNPSLASNIIILNNIPIEIIGSCIAGSAYYLLLILNLATPGIKIKKRICIFLFSSLAFLTLNILRIVLLSIMFVSGVSLFDITHKLFWYLGSTIFVVGIWFLSVKIFKIKEIPFYSDIMFLLASSKKTKKTKRSKRH